MSAKSFFFECKQSEESDDRSSVSSIPWNSDAIKQNQITWERIERMLHHEEPIPDEELDLRQEIKDWQAKFPQLANSHTRKAWLMKQNTFNTSSTNVSEILDASSSLDNDSLDDEPIFDDAKPFNERTANGELADVFGQELHISAAPFVLRQRKNARLLEQRHFSTTSSDSPVPAKATKYKNMPKSTFHAQTNVVAGNSRFHMPPILNVLESKRRFCALANNRSFVQLTQIHQAKSAAVHSRQPPPERQYRIWNKPLAAVSVNSRFLNNRNAIILPALQTTTTTTSSHRSGGGVRQFNSFTNSNSSLSSGDVRTRQQRIPNSQTTTTSTSGRSISAVPIQNARIHGAFYHL